MSHAVIAGIAMDSIPPSKPTDNAQEKDGIAELIEDLKKEWVASGHTDPFDPVDAIDRMAKAHVASMSSPLDSSPNDFSSTIASAMSMFNSFNESPHRSYGAPSSKMKTVAMEDPLARITSNVSLSALAINLDDHIKDGRNMVSALLALLSLERKKVMRFTAKQKEYFSWLKHIEAAYMAWHEKADMVIKRILPSRLSEFNSGYQGIRELAQFVPAAVYNLTDGLGRPVLAARADYWESKVRLIEEQCKTLEDVKLCFDLSVARSQQVLQADLSDSALCAARELYSKGVLRAAGAIAGVVLEQHLAIVIKAHTAPLRKKNPSMNDYSHMLRDRGIAELPTWRLVQRLGDLYNLCLDAKSEPTKEDVEELISGVDKIIKTVF